MIEIETACFTWIRTGGLDQVIRLFGGHPLVSEPETLDGLLGIAPEDLPDDATGVALVARHGEWAVIVEPFAFRGLSRTSLGQVAARHRPGRFGHHRPVAGRPGRVRRGGGRPPDSAGRP